MQHFNLFISHAWRYSEHYQTVVRWLNEAKDQGLLTWSNYSVPSHDPLIDPNTIVGKKRLEGMIDDQIRPASKVIILSGMYVVHSDWIQFEVLKAVTMGKYIIGVEPWGQERVPTIVQEYANEMIGWNKMSLINAVRER